MKKIAYVDQPCDRCGGKKFISRTWKEKVPTYSGKFTEVEYSQIECTNKECQAEFERKQQEETKKKEAIRVKREENEATRKANSLLQANKARANKSRI